VQLEENIATARCVLIVDDNRDAADSLANLLAATGGHQTQAVYSGAAALAQLQLFTPDVILLDIGLPDIDGYEIARRIRQLPDGDRINLIALTGYGQENDRRHSAAAGFDSHLLKPVDLATLQKLMANDDSRALC
jgi:CheY-like chemotaxis protein